MNSADNGAQPQITKLSQSFSLAAAVQQLHSGSCVLSIDTKLPVILLCQMLDAIVQKNNYSCTTHE